MADKSSSKTDKKKTSSKDSTTGEKEKTSSRSASARVDKDSGDKKKKDSSKDDSKKSKKSKKTELPTDNLRELVKARLLAMFDELPGEDDMTWKVLIVDKYTLSVISSACRVRDILQKNITIVEYLHKSRQPFPQMGGVYFIAPEEESVKAFLKDFEDPSKPRYSSAHLFFSSRVPTKIMKMIGEHKAASKVKTLSEVNIDFLAIEQKVFSLNTENDMKLTFGDTTDDRKGFVDYVSNKLLSFCVTYGQIPYIRHSSNSVVSTRVATALHDKLSKLKGESETKLENKNSVIMIVDRGEDCLVPILHDFYYQSMSFDLMKIGEDCIYTQEAEGKDGKEKKVILDEYDPIWLQHRHTHFAELGLIIKKDFDSFMEEHKEINSSKEKLKEGANLQQMIRKLPQYQEKINQYTLHINLARELFNKFREQKLKDIGLQEQNMVVGVDQENKKISNMLTTISPFLSSNDAETQNKLRLVMIYLITQGTNDEKKEKLLKMAKLTSSEHQQIIENLKWLGVQLNKSTSISSKLSNLFLSDSGKKKKNSEVDYVLSRYVPKLKQIAEDMLDDKLSPQDYPYIKEPTTFKLVKKTDDKKGSDKKKDEDLTSGRSKTVGPSWDRLAVGGGASGSSGSKDGEKKSDKDRNKGKLILFVIGGMTHAEMRMAYELDREYKLDVIVGSTSVLTPQRFLDKLSNLKGSGSSSGGAKKGGRDDSDDDDLS